MSIYYTAYPGYRPGGNAVRKNGYRLFEAIPAILYTLSKWIHRFKKSPNVLNYGIMWYTQRDDGSLNSTKGKRRKVPRKHQRSRKRSQLERLLRVQASSHGMVLAVALVF
jgi:hypothetical protein